MVAAAQTPSQAEAMEIAVHAKNVKVEMGSKGGMSTGVKLAHVLAVVVSGVIALCVSSVLADGTSVIKLKHTKDLPVVTAPELKKDGLSLRLDQLLGPTYGIGLHHDQAGYTWTEAGAGEQLKDIVSKLGMPAVIAAVPRVISTDGLKHPVHFLDCDDLQRAGLSAMGLGYIAEAVAVLMVIFHALALAGLLPAKLTKIVAGGIWLVLSAGFLIVVCIAIGVYNATWTCHNQIIPSIKLSEHFDFAYGFAFAVVGFAASLLVFTTTLFCTSTREGFSPSKGALVKVGGVYFIGAVLAMVSVLAVLAGNDTFKEKPAKDPLKNVCAAQKWKHAGPGDKYFSNTDCMKDGVTQVLEQAGANVTAGYRGGLDAANRVPITVPYSQTDLCPVNVHWHLGAEHLSIGQYDENGKGPDPYHRQLASGPVRKGLQCHHYDKTDSKFTTPYTWKHCTKMHVGETYEVHWPHSAAGACGTVHQYQTPFYDGVFCKDGVISITPLNTYQKIGVQAQVFTIVNDEEYYYPDLFKVARALSLESES